MIENMATKSNQAEVKKESWLKKRAIFFLMLLLVIAISVGLFFFAQRYPDKLEELAGLGYLGVFIVSLVSSLTVILPVPGVLVIFPLVLALKLNLILVVLAGSTGGIIGEMSGYVAGYSGRGITNGGRMYHRVEGWIGRWGTWTIFLFAAVPLMPFDIAGIVAGALRYPLWKFLLVGWLGKSLKFSTLVFAVVWGWETLLRYLG